MFGTAIIVFRETLEAALLIGIIAAATHAIPGRSRWLAAGLGAGLAGAVLVALFAEVIGAFADGMGQELFNAGVLGVAVLMLAWHNIWMASHGAQLAADARAVGREILDGRRECSVLLAAVGLAVLREGSETVLFLHGIAAGGGTSGMLLGGLLGAALGAATGYAVYAGLLRVPLRWFFSATSLLVLLLAAGMASQAAGFLIQADILPGLASPLWDTSNVVSSTSISGMLLRSLAGYDPQPAGMQVAFYAATVIAIGAGMRFVNKPGPRVRLRSRS